MRQRRRVGFHADLQLVPDDLLLRGLVVLNVVYTKEAARFVVASFAPLFGDATYGRRLRDWTLDQGKMLVWGRGTTPSYNGRFLDPVVLAQLGEPRVPLNISDAVVTESSLDAFQSYWDEAVRLRETV